MRKVLVVLLLGIVIFFLSELPANDKIEIPVEEPVDLDHYDAGECFTVDSILTFCIPVKSASNKEFLYEMQSANELIKFFNILDPDSIPLVSSVCISAYQGGVYTSLDSAFYNYLIKRHPEDKEADYGLISYDKYIVDNIILYRKISRREGPFCNIMYYFMENNYSFMVYEIKVGGRLSDLENLKMISENIALSVRFKDDDEFENISVTSSQIACLSK